jgi:hypothetical protein
MGALWEPYGSLYLHWREPLGSLVVHYTATLGPLAGRRRAVSVRMPGLSGGKPDWGSFPIVLWRGGGGEKDQLENGGPATQDAGRVGNQRKDAKRLRRKGEAGDVTSEGTGDEGRRQKAARSENANAAYSAIAFRICGMPRFPIPGYTLLAMDLCGIIRL